MKKIIYIAIPILLFIAFIFSETLLFVTKAELKKTRYELRVEISESSVESMKDLWELRDEFEEKFEELSERLDAVEFEILNVLDMNNILFDLEFRVSKLEREVNHESKRVD